MTCGHAPLNAGPIELGKVMELWHRSVVDGDLLGETKPNCWVRVMVASHWNWRCHFSYGLWGNVCFSTVKEGKGGLSPWILRPALLQITWLACFVQSVVGLRCFYLGEYHMFQQGQEALCPERIHISNDR